MKIAYTGIGSDELRARIESVATALGMQPGAVDFSGEPDQSYDAEHDWEIIVLGSTNGQNGLIDRVNRLVHVNPVGFVIALDPAGTQASRNRLQKAGAFEALSDNPDFEDLQFAISRAHQLYLRRERQMDTEKMSVITQLAAGVNHEINNPLTGLMGTAELILLENRDLPDKVRGDIETILAQARRIQTITRRLKHLDHLRTVHYDGGESMLDLSGVGEESEAGARGGDDFVFGTPRIFIVDDNELIIDLIERLLASRFSVEHATRAYDALNRLRDNEYDLILADLVMPQMDGLELVREIRRMNPDQRIVITTAYPADERVSQALLAGALGMIKKPFNFEELEGQLWAALKAPMPAHRGEH